jgi:transglutaminase-like putative cysteine protease
VRARTVSHLLAYAVAATAAAALALSPLPRSAWLLVAGAIAAGAAWDRRGGHPVPAWLLTVLGLAGFLASLVPLSRTTLAEQSLTALSYLLAVKLLAPKRRRDHLQILAVALMLIAGAASLEPEVVFAVLLVLTLFLGVSLLVWLPFSEQPAVELVDRGLLRRLAAVSGGLAAGSLPLAVALFVILPRSVNPFWGGLGGASRQGVSGISDQLQLGQVSSIAQSGAVAFRADLEELPGPLPEVPYWRGTVLEETDGLRWSAVERYRPSSVSPPGTAVRLTYYVEPHGARQLFLLETPSSAWISARVQLLGASRVLRLPAPLGRRIRYQAFSVPGGGYPERLTAEERERNLRVPAATSPAVRELARTLAGGERDPGAVAQRLLAHFARGYTYSLELPAADGDPLEAFVLRHRTGYCEYFAAALAIMLREDGVPARVVGGYLGGQYNEAGNYYLVTQAAAHAWVEAYLGGRWVRLDPTPAARELGGTFASRRAGRAIPWLDNLRMRWNSYVIQYDAESQLALARRSGASLRAWRLRPGRLTAVGGAALGAAALLFVGSRLLRRRRLTPLDARHERFSRLAARAGVARLPHEGPLDHARRYGAARGRLERPILAFGELYAACRYGGRPADERTLAELDRLLASIKEAPSRPGAPA